MVRKFVNGGWVACALGLMISSGALYSWGQSGDLPNSLVNGNLESIGDNGDPTGWGFSPADTEGFELSIDRTNPIEGQSAALVDTTGSPESGQGFGSFSQVLNAQDYQGRRVRFRAAVKTADRGTLGQGQLWLRVDLGGTQKMGAFDNMQDRPIKVDEWEYFEIVADVAKDAKQIVFGLLVIGQAKVWIDDAQFEIVDSSVSTTGRTSADSSPTQPFWNGWLALPAVAILLMFLSNDLTGRWSRFAFCFTVSYWILYYFPQPLTQLVPWYVPQFGVWYESQVVDPVVRWSARNVLGIERELVSSVNNGSGDTTFAYVQALVTLVAAAVMGGLWTILDWRKTDFAWAKDWFRSFLRYVFAAILLGYGLAKLGTVYNQFPPLGSWRLDQPYVESSPMGLAWTFMSASRAYTFFGGAMEVVAALLLVWRRTALLGAFVGMGVMANIVMMNFCYDIPVKLFSSHLLVTGLLILLPDWKRVWNLFWWHQSTESVSLRPPQTGRTTIWVHWILKGAMVVMLVGFPLYNFVAQEWNHNRSGLSDLIGDWQVAEFTADDGVPPKTHWTKLSIQRNYANPNANEVNWILTAAEDSTRQTYRLKEGEKTLAIVGNHATLPPEVAFDRQGEFLILSWDKLSVKLQPAQADYLLTNRGFRWINEFPFNR